MSKALTGLVPGNEHQSCRSVPSTFTIRTLMNLCWIVPGANRGHVRDVDVIDRTKLVREGYKEFRLICSTPSGTRNGTLYVQAWQSPRELASFVDQAGLALFGGCTSIEVHRPDTAAAVTLPHSDLAGMMNRQVR